MHLGFIEQCVAPHSWPNMHKQSAHKFKLHSCVSIILTVCHRFKSPEASTSSSSLLSKVKKIDARDTLHLIDAFHIIAFSPIAAFI